MPAVDLTPFGFTATENLAYTALVELGPSSGYAVAKQLGIARANAYQALDGLVTKSAAVLVGTDPRKYRALQPQSLLTLISEAELRKIDRLEREVFAQPTSGAQPLIRLEGGRAIRETATRAIVRADRPVLCVAPAEELRALAPALRARAVAGRTAAVWCIGSAADMPVPLDGEIPPDAVQRHFPQAPMLLLADGAMAAFVGDGPVGYWSTHPLFGGVVSAAAAALTGA